MSDFIRIKAEYNNNKITDYIFPKRKIESASRAKDGKRFYMNINGSEYSYYFSKKEFENLSAQLVPRSSGSQEAIVILKEQIKELELKVEDLSRNISVIDQLEV